MSEIVIDLTQPDDDRGVKSRSKRKLRIYTDEKKQRAIELRRGGVRNAVVSRLLGVPESTVRTWLAAADVKNKASSGENSNASNSDCDVDTISSGTDEGIGSISDVMILPDAMEPNDNDTPGNYTLAENLSINKYIGDTNSANAELSNGNSTSEKRKREDGESHEAGDKRKKSQATESASSVGWQQPSTSLQALNAMSPSSSYQQQPTAHPGVVKPKPVMAAGITGELPGSSQNLSQVQMFAFYQQWLINAHMQRQQQLQNEPQQQEPSVSYNNQQLQQLAATLYSTATSQAAPLTLLAQKTPKGSGRGRRRASTAAAQLDVMQQYSQAYSEHVNNAVLVQNMLLQGLHQQQSNVPASLQMPVAGYSQNPVLPSSSSVVTSQNPTRSSKNAAPTKSKSRDTASPLSGVRSPLPSPLPRGHSPLSLASPLSRVQSPLTDIHSAPLPSSTPNPEEYQSLEQQQQQQQQLYDYRQNQQIEQQQQQYDYRQNQKSEQQQQQYDHRQKQQSEQQQQQHDHRQIQKSEQQQQQYDHRQNRQNEQQQQQYGEQQQQNGEQQQQNGEQQQQQNEQSQQYQHQQQLEEQEQPDPTDSAHHSQDNQTDSVSPSQDNRGSPSQVENVDGYPCDDIGQLAELRVLRMPPSMMNPLHIRDSRRINVNNLAVRFNGVPNGVPAAVQANYLVRTMREEFVDEKVKEFCTESNAINYEKTQCRVKSYDRSSENKENEMSFKPVSDSKRSKRKGKKNGKRAIKKKHAKKAVVVKKECIKLEAVDVEFVKVETIKKDYIKEDCTVPAIKEECIMQTIKEECIKKECIEEEYAKSQSLQMAIQTIITADNTKKRKRTWDTDIEKFKCKFQPNQMVSLCANWLSLFNEDV